MDVILTLFTPFRCVVVEPGQDHIRVRLLERTTHTREVATIQHLQGVSDVIHTTGRDHGGKHQVSSDDNAIGVHILHQCVELVGGNATFSETSTVNISSGSE